MIAVQLQGGLGNQMFQYAFGRALALKFNTRVAFDLSFLLNPQLFAFHTPRYYELGCFSLGQRFLSQEEADRLNRAGIHSRKNPFRAGCRRVAETSVAFDPQYAEQARPSTHLVGFWQSYRYFQDITDQIREDFRLSRPLSAGVQGMADRIKAQNAVGVHVRRGDYVAHAGTQARHGSCSTAYYAAAMSVAAERLKRPVFFVFSDDPAWCRENLRCPGETVHVEPAYLPAEDLHLISLCGHQIIANSSFSWWAAWLNPGPKKFVVAPWPWFSGPRAIEPDLYPEGWVCLDKSTGRSFQK